MKIKFWTFPSKMPFIVDVFLKLRTSKNVVNQISKKSPFLGPFGEQHINGAQTHLKSELHHLYQIYWSLWRELTWKKSILVKRNVLRMFVNMLTVDDNYSLLNRDNLRLPIQMELSHKQKRFSEFNGAFLKARLNSEHF